MEYFPRRVGWDGIIKALNLNKNKMNAKFYDSNWNPLEDLLAGRKIPKDYKKKGKWRRVLKKYWLLLIISREDREFNRLCRRLEKLQNKKTK